MQPVIQVRGLGKRYHLGVERHSLLRNLIAHKARSLVSLLAGARRAKGEEFWALRDLEFSVNQGDVVGIVGRNGAGKSTLLKILSRITEPTTGRIEIEGRVASLLEVGTGFHPELSGRDNIFLNGAILGMTRREIIARFDEIVAFAEVERFIDTPVKHYSSGMYVRLAFAVAAHLAPEILIVDEVLAVGDGRFQEKCLGKIASFSKAGRTVLFVSHNMDSVLRLCTRALWLDKGRLHRDGSPSEVVSLYFNESLRSESEISLAGRERPGWVHGRSRLTRISWPGDPQRPWMLPYGEKLAFDLEIEVPQTLGALECLYSVFTLTGFEIASGNSRHCADLGLAQSGRHRLRVRVEDLRLVPGRYHLNLGLRSDLHNEDFVAQAACLEVIPNDTSAKGAVGQMRCVCVPEVSFFPIPGGTP